MEQLLAHPTVWIEVPASWGDPARRFVFDKPLAVWQADTLADVRPALERVEIAQREGLYVAGFISYEAAPAFDPALKTPVKGELPYAWFASFKDKLQTSNLKLQSEKPEFQVSGFRFQVSHSDYVSAVETALSHIRAGDIYQVNYTIRAELDVEDPFALFQRLLAAVPMPHAAYIDTTDRTDPWAVPEHGLSPRAGEVSKKGAGTVQLVSLSPELFIRRRGGSIESRPMKGTARREPSWAADEAARTALSRDEKNRAENVMIVDLVRNDLGRICKMGSITVPELWRVDRFPTVHQMTSLVRGELREDVSLFDIFAALFPPGSVTGAPKIRATEIIANREPQPRGIYCGTIALFFPNGDFECNVAIRTLEVHRSSFIVHRSLLGLGSGIVADSDPETEWRETLLKGEFVTAEPRDFILYETIRYDIVSGFRFQVSGFLDLHLHLRRLRQSCLYFGRPFPLHELIVHLRTLQKTLGNEPARIKLDLSISSLLHPSIETHVVRENLTWPPGGMTLMLSELVLDPADFRLYHKTNLRPEKYAELEKARSLGASEVLFMNSRGELCEGALSNIILRLDGQWLTPALHCGLLPGVWREKQLASGRVREAILTLDDLNRAEGIYMGNAVRGEGKVLQILRPA